LAPTPDAAREVELDVEREGWFASLDGGGAGPYSSSSSSSASFVSKLPSVIPIGIFSMATALDEALSTTE